MLWIVAAVCSRVISERGNLNPALLACPSSLPASSGSYSDCTFSGRTSRAFNVTSGTLTLRSCVFTDCSHSGDSGGCIYSTGTLNVYSCSFTSCKVTGGSWNGGAICTKDASCSSVIEDSEFSECSSSFGGGAICFHYSAQCIVLNCQFTACESSGASGGAIRQFYSGPTMTITSCTFVNCKEKATFDSVEGGGAIKCGSGTAKISQCSFDSCSALRAGGAICCFAYESLHTLSVSVSHCEIRKCSASRGGGGISCSNYATSLSISYLTVTDCTAASSLGQAIHIYSCDSFKWDHLCITGTGTLVKADDSTSVPTKAELKECVTPLFTQQIQLYSNRRLRFMEVFIMYYILA